MIYSTNSGAFVYHDGYSITGISFIIDDILEQKYDKIIISSEKASEFIHGSLDHTQWFFWNNCLYPKNSGIKKDGTFNIDTDYYILKENTDGLISIKIDKKQLIITSKEKISKAVNNSDKLSFFLTEKNDPSIILYNFDITTDDLFTGDIKIPLKIDKDFDIYTKRIWCEYSVEYLEE